MNKKKLLICFIVLILISYGIIDFIPFTFTTKDGNEYCRYRLAVYEYTRIESEGEGYGDSDTYFGSLILEKKVGGVLEYFGLKDIENKTK